MLEPKFKYLLMHAEFILAPYVKLSSQREMKSWNEYCKQQGFDSLVSTKPVLYIKDIPKSIYDMLFSFLFSDSDIKECKLFSFINEAKKSDTYLSKVLKGRKLLDKVNSYVSLEELKETLDIKMLLEIIKKEIDLLPNDDNKNQMLKKLDEYFNLYKEYLSNNIMITCQNNYVNENIKRPEGSLPCNKKVSLDKKSIFYDGVDDSYYQKCPFCGFIIHINPILISNDIKNYVKNKENIKEDKNR